VFKSAPAPVAASVVEPAGDLIPVSVLALDLNLPSNGSWLDYLASKGVEVTDDDLGRPSVSRDDARRLLAEQTLAEARRREMWAQQEAAAVEADRVRRAQIWGGLHWTELPDGVHPAAAMLQSAKDAEPKRVSPLEEALSGETATFHPWPTGEAS
jgi:hypothetical protein